MCGTTWNASNNNKLSCHLQCPRVCACMCVGVCVLEFCLACSKPVALLMMAATEREKWEGGNSSQLLPGKLQGQQKASRTWQIVHLTCLCVCVSVFICGLCVSVRVCVCLCMCVCVYLIRRHSSCCAAYHLAAFTARPKFD